MTYKDWIGEKGVKAVEGGGLVLQFSLRGEGGPDKWSRVDPAATSLMTPCPPPFTPSSNGSAGWSPNLLSALYSVVKILPIISASDIALYTDFASLKTLTLVFKMFLFSWPHCPNKVLAFLNL